MTPAPRSAALALAGQAARVRRLVLAQARACETVAIYRGDEEMAVAFLARHGWRRIELAVAVAPQAGAHMRRLVRIAQVTLAPIAETHIIVVRVHPFAVAGTRMATAAGFVPARLKRAGFWIFRRHADGSTDRRRRRGEARTGEIAADPGGGQ